MAEITQLEVMWNQVKERARQLFTPISFSAFIEPLVPQDIVNRKIVLKAETDLTASVITTSHAEKLREAVSTSDTGLSDFIIVVDGSET